MYIKRNIDTFLLNWKNDPRRKPLLLRGVRQCGKTSAVRHLAEGFNNYVEINLERQPSLHALFEGDIDIKRILARLELEASSSIIPGETLIFIDEIQACPKAVTALRYFYEDYPQLHVIAAGSLLEFVLNNTKKNDRIEFPVGRVRSLYMYPFSFTEFLSGIGETRLADYLKSFDPDTGTNIAHTKLLEHYKTFLVVGGMPEAVAEFCSSGSFLACQRIHRDIMVSFRDDIGKYGSEVPSDTIRRVLDFATHNVCRQIKASSAISGVSAYHFDECIKLLRRAGLVYPVKASSCESPSLGSGEKETNKKLLFFDTGIYLSECHFDAGELLSANIFDILNKGDIVEMQTGLELIKAQDPFDEAAVYYWYRSGANAEVDYVISKRESIIPVEVKASGKGSMQSLYSFLSTHPSTPHGIRLSLEDFSEYNSIKVYPVYAAEKLLQP